MFKLHTLQCNLLLDKGRDVKGIVPFIIEGGTGTNALTQNPICVWSSYLEINTERKFYDNKIF